MTASQFTVQTPYRLPATTVARQLRVVPAEGLSHVEAKRRLVQFGPNSIPIPHRNIFLDTLKDRGKDLLVLILVAGAVISWLAGERADALIIAVALLLDTTLSFLQVWRTQRALRALRQSVEHFTYVIRAGRTQRVPSSFLVPGDIIEIRAGEKVTADARILTARGLQVAEAALTGESKDVVKEPRRLTSRTPLGNRSNMLFNGTVVTGGTGHAVVVATGIKTEFGRIAQMLKTETSPESPLRHKLQQTGMRIGVAIIVLVGTLGAIQLFQGVAFSIAARTALTLIVSAIPEDLTIILTIALTVGMVRILRQKGVVRELRSAETLGAATVICTDKTGTLTEGNMTAQYFDCLQGTRIDAQHPPQEPVLELALIGFALATDAHRTQHAQAEYVGSATERTALAFVEQLDFLQSELTRHWKQRDSLSFSPEWKYRASLHDHPTQDHQVLFVSGAPEVLLEKSATALDTDHQPIHLTAARRGALQQQIQIHASQGERLLGVAVRRRIKKSDITHADVSQLLFLGVLVITDPIRADVRESIRQTQEAGVAVKLVTGDYPATARAVARDVGLTVPDDALLSGDELETMSQETLAANVNATTVFARVSPIDKQRIIRALQQQGHVVAMTGDGVNDAVALKSADIGVAMGSGKDIAKEAADLILLDDSFTTIVRAIREGRVIRDNVRKVIAFLLATNVAEVALFLISMLLRGPLPLLPAQILWINLVTDGTSDIALSLEPQERNVMQRRPEDPRASLLGTHILRHILSTGAILTFAAGALYWYLAFYLNADIIYMRTMMFTFVSVASLLSTWSFRSLSETILRRGVWQNPWISLSLGFSFMLQLLALYLPFLQRFFNTMPLGTADWALILTLALATLVLIDLRKLLLPTGQAITPRYAALLKSVA